jgi:hypothetical protein
MGMNIINKQLLSTLGYDFIPKQYLPKGKDEYYLRNKQNRNGINYRKLTALEMEVLVRNGNQSDDWSKVLVSAAFNAELVKNCKFYGLVRIGKLEPYYLEFHNLRMPVGLYNSTIISCDFGDNVAVDNVNYISHYIIGNDVMLANINELATTNYAKFGNGIIKQGEDEARRVQLEICNENAGRSVIPFNGMLPGDAYLWSKYRDDEKLLNRFREFTELKFDKHRGYYGKIGDRTVIKNCKIIKDVWIGTDAYMKGANKVKNVTINSSPNAKSQIGEGCEIVNGIIGEGCRIFYGVKAVRFFMASHSQLKYGARLINSYLGNNATISCCEVLNSLIYPAHEQHHNNSFLCAAVIMGQSNMAAGATIGSNHNSRGADGEIMADRGFWPGLCVSLKHNSKFAAFSIIAKGDFPAELNIPIPFSLISNDVSNDELVIMPAYWFLYNMYALARNAWKYVDRDKRTERIQQIEYDYLAPDTINQMIHAMRLLELYTGKAAELKKKKQNLKLKTEKELIDNGRKLLRNNDLSVDALDILAEGFENTKRTTRLIKVRQAYNVFNDIIAYYAAIQFVQSGLSFNDLKKKLSAITQRKEWLNIGGQLIEKDEIEKMKSAIRNGKINSWDEVHEFYVEQGKKYPAKKLQHAFAAYFEVRNTNAGKFSLNQLKDLLKKSVTTREWMVKGIEDSRSKDYSNKFRTMMYDTQKEMDEVLGKLSENSFIKQQKAELESYRSTVTALLSKLK